VSVALAVAVAGGGDKSGVVGVPELSSTSLRIAATGEDGALCATDDIVDGPCVLKSFNSSSSFMTRVTYLDNFRTCNLSWSNSLLAVASAALR